MNVSPSSVAAVERLVRQFLRQLLLESVAVELRSRVLPDGSVELTTLAPTGLATFRLSRTERTVAIELLERADEARP